MIRTLNLPESLARCVAPSAPVELRLSVAQGMIPMAPAERLSVLTALLADQDGSIRAAAKQAWEGLPPSFVAEAVGDTRLPEPVLDLVVAVAPEDTQLVCRVLRHPRVGARTLARVVESTDEAVLTQAAENQRVLDRQPELARRLVANPRLPPDVRGRLQSLFGDGDAEETSPGGSEPTADEDPQALPELPPELLEDEAPVEAEGKNLYQLVQTLTVAEKIKLATLGSKSARRLLIRDTNKLVSTAVIRSPKIQEDEVLGAAQDRSSPEEVLRLILQRRDWLRSYPIRLALCQNPKTALPKALRLLETLHDRDLRQIAKSRNVPSPVSAGATRVLARRGKI